METAIWQNFGGFSQEDFILVGISNTSNQNVINNFIEENSLTFPILYDPGSSGGVQGGDTYDLYYMPNDGSPYPRDFIIDQNGTIAYANNEIDTEWMSYVINGLIDTSSDVNGDVNQDGTVNVLDVILTVNIVLGTGEFSSSADINQDDLINVLDIVSLVNIILAP